MCFTVYWQDRLIYIFIGGNNSINKKLSSLDFRLHIDAFNNY